MADPDLVAQFAAVTGAADHIAEHILEAHGWNLESSVNWYLESGGVGHGTQDPMAASPPRQQQRPPLTANAGQVPRSSPIEVLDEDDEDTADIRAMAASLGRQPARRHVEDIVDDDWMPGGSDGEGAAAAAAAGGRPRGRGPRGFGDAAGPSAAAVEVVDMVGGEDEVEAPPVLPDDVDMEEQRMLLAAMTGEAYQGRIPDFDNDPRYRAAPLSPGARSREALRQEQDAAYHESLASDRRKAEAAERAEREAREAAEAARREVERVRREAAEAAAKLQRTLTHKEASLPEEPPAGDADAVQLVVRMPGGGRLSRRFRQGDRLRSIFDFVDVSGRGSEVEPGSYNLVSQFPRRVFEEGGGDRTLADANLGHKQEALFIEMK